MQYVFASNEWFQMNKKKKTKTEKMNFLLICDIWIHWNEWKNKIPSKTEKTAANRLWFGGELTGKCNNKKNLENEQMMQFSSVHMLF